MNFFFKTDSFLFFNKTILFNLYKHTYMHTHIIVFVMIDIFHFLVTMNRMDESRQPLSRKLSIPSSQINPYRMIIILRLIVLGFFFHYRIMHPVENAYALWLVSVICEIWFTLSWILDQFSKWFPVIRVTYLDRLSLRQVIHK